MSSREGVLTAIHHEQPDRVPLIIGVSNATGIKIVLCGSIDTQRILPSGTPAKVRDEVRRVINILGPGGGFLLGGVHTIMNDVPAENVLAMVDAAEEFGRYPLRLRVA